MRRAAHLLAFSAGLSMIAVGCGSDATGTTGDALTQQEAYAIFSELQFAVADALNGQTSAPAGSGAFAASPITPMTGACGGGGTVTVSGEADDNLDPQTGYGSFSFTLTETVNACVVQTTGANFTVNGDPDINIVGNLTVDQNGLGGNYDMTGGFSYTSDDGRAGTCGVDVSLDFSNRTVDGKVCGKTISG